MRFAHASTVAVALAFAAAGAAHAGSVNAVTAFSSVNPHGVWSYGYGTTGTSFTLYTDYVANNGGQTNVNVWTLDGYVPVVGRNQSGVTVIGTAGTNLFPTNVLLMHPGESTDSIVQWTAPKAGTYKFSGLYEILDEDPTGIAALIFDNATDITSTAFNGGTGVLTGPPANLATKRPGGSEAFSFTLTVKKREVVSFGLNNDGNYLFDTTGLKLLVQSVTAGP